MTRIRERGPTGCHLAAFKAFLAEVQREKGDPQGALRLVEEALGVSTEKAHDWSRSIALRVHGDTLRVASPGAAEQAAASIRAAIAIQTSRECRCDLAWSYVALARLAAAQGDTQGAREAAAVATELFRAMGIARGLARAEAAAASIEPSAATGARAA